MTSTTTSTPPANPVVWIEIPVSNLERSARFFNDVLQTEMIRQEMGPNLTMVFPYTGKDGVAGHLYEGKPAAAGSGNTVHFMLPDSLDAGMERVTRAGGKIVSPVIEIPDGKFTYCQDIDGNSFGIFTR